MGILEGKSTVITGAGQGIGKACVEVFVREGARVLAVDFSGAEKDTAAELGCGAASVGTGGERAAHRSVVKSVAGCVGAVGAGRRCARERQHRRGK